MLFAILAAGAVICAILAIAAKRLLTSAIWLAGVSALSAILFYLLGAQEVAVIELSVGVGLVTVLFVFAISIAGDETMDARSAVPRLISLLLVLVSTVLLGWMFLPAAITGPARAESGTTIQLWQERGLDVLVQAVLIFAGALGVLGLLAPERRLAEPAAAAKEGNQP